MKNNKVIHHTVKLPMGFIVDLKKNKSDISTCKIGDKLTYQHISEKMLTHCTKFVTTDTVFIEKLENGHNIGIVCKCKNSTIQDSVQFFADDIEMIGAVRALLWV